MDGQTTFISRGANIAFEKGILIVASVGNSGNNTWGTVLAPGDAPGVLSVGAVDAIGNHVPFSSGGPTADNRVKPDVMARGKAATTILSNNDVSPRDGTSFSSPIMAGAVTCLWQAFPSMTNAEIMQLVKESSSLYNNPTNPLGYGIPDFEKTLETLSILDIQAAGIDVYPNPVQDRLFINALGKQYDIKLYTADGRLVKQEKLNNSTNLSLVNLTSGMYLLEIGENNKRYMLKISKQ